MSKKYFKVIPAVYLVLKNDDNVLLLRRANTGYKDGMYSLPAGHVDGDETLEYAMCREANEEIGLSITVDSLELVHIQHRRSTEEDLSNERIDFYFMCNDWEGEPKNMEPHKCDDLSFFPAQNLPDNTIDHVMLALSSINEGSVSSNYGWN